MTIEATTDRERLLDELARCFVRSALRELLADPSLLQKNAAEPGEERRQVSTKSTRQHDCTAFPDAEAT